MNQKLRNSCAQILTLCLIVSNYSLANDGASEEQTKPVFTNDRQLTTGQQATSLLIKYRDEARLLKATAPHPELFQPQQRATTVGQPGNQWQLWRTDSNIEQLVDKLKADPAIDSVEINHPRRPLSRPLELEHSDHLLWGIENTGQQPTPGSATSRAGADMNLLAAWDITTGSRDVVVAVIDDGVALEHPDLKANLWRNPGEIAGDGIDNDGNGYVDDIHGWDFAFNDNNPQPQIGDLGHGTQVAGAIGASANGEGVVGAAWNVRIMALRFGYDVHSTMLAMEYAAENGADIINVSFGGSYPSRAEYKLIEDLERRGILVVAAAGNHHNNNDAAGLYPASYDLPNIISVAASNANDRLAEWAQHGAVSVDLAAPGVGIFTTTDKAITGNYYGYIDGSSFSAPYVAGIAALVKSQYPNAEYSELKASLLAAVDPMAYASGTASGGRINAAKAVSYMPPAVPMIRSWQLDDSDSYSSQRNGRLDAQETATLIVNFDTFGNSNSTWTGNLECANAAVTVNTLIGQASSQPHQTGFAPTSAQLQFELTSTAREQLRRMRHCQLTFDNGFERYSRPIALESGHLSPNNTLHSTLQTHQHDDYHHWTIHVPAGTERLELLLSGTQDIDLIAKPGSIPDYAISLGINPDSDGSFFIVDSQSHFSNSNGGTERVSINNPAAGTWYVVVANYSQQANTPYQLSLRFNTQSSSSVQNSQSGKGGGNSSSAGGGGNMDALVFAILFSAIGWRRKRYLFM